MVLKGDSVLERYSRPAMQEIWSDEFKFRAWLNVELAVCEARHQLGEITYEEIKEIRSVKLDVQQINELESSTGHEMTAFLKSVSAYNRPADRWLHYGLTSSDVMDTGTSLQILHASAILDDGLTKLIEVLRRRAIEFRNTPMIGRSHGMYAEPISFGLKLAIWWDEMRRHRRRLTEAVNDVAVGMMSGPVGTHSAIPLEVEERACKILGLPVAPLTTQALTRDRHAALITRLALIAASIEKMATEIRLLHQSDIAEVQEPRDPARTDSSSMPHKSNPLKSERLTGLARLVRSNSAASLETVALWGERDLTNSSVERVIIPQSFTLIDFMLAEVTIVIDGLVVDTDAMRRNLADAEPSYGTHLHALNLISKGHSRERAFELARESMGTSIDAKEADSIRSLDFHMRRINSLFERAGLSDG